MVEGAGFMRMGDLSEDGVEGCRSRSSCCRLGTVLEPWLSLLQDGIEVVPLLVAEGRW